MDIDKTIEEVKQTVRREKARDLKPIPSDFYSTAAAAAQNLESEMEKIGRPRSVEFKMLEDELSGLVTDVETVFMKRAGKVVERATSGAFTNSKNILLKKDIDKLLPAEQELYEDVLQAIFKARAVLIADLTDAESDGSSHVSSTAATVINENYVLVRILKDLPEFMGEDKRVYQLRAQDEVKLPAANANLLIKRGIALGIPGSSEGNPES
ncbi:MAG: hypothetical protein LBU81_02170 [Methanosarcinales archaeon]|jgi:DNA replication factor GINS|nr:hypothetical protein [Methanosarcinales archaeon]